jgi:AbrB family looped-hinge helix DNA binding protein
MGEIKMFATTTRLAPGGRIVIPAAVREKMGMHTGDEVILKFEEDVLKIFNRQHALREAQAVVAQYNPKKISLSETLIQERRAEAKDE